MEDFALTKIHVSREDFAPTKIHAPGPRSFGYNLDLATLVRGKGVVSQQELYACSIPLKGGSLGGISEGKHP
jgi:hypothetical protein